jgi:hypothetical protein
MIDSLLYCFGISFSALKPSPIGNGFMPSNSFYQNNFKTTAFDCKNGLGCLAIQDSCLLLLDMDMDTSISIPTTISTARISRQIGIKTLVKPNPSTNGFFINLCGLDNSQQSSSTSVSIHNIQGRKLKTIISNNHSNSPSLTFYWNGNDDYNKRLAPGYYFVNIYKNSNLISSTKTCILK